MKNTVSRQFKENSESHCSKNPELDVGQAEGAFVFGLGLFMSEKVIYDSKTGRQLTNGTWVGLQKLCSYCIDVSLSVFLFRVRQFVSVCCSFVVVVVVVVLSYF